MAANGQRVHDHFYRVDAAVHVRHLALAQPLLAVLNANQHNYNPIKGPMELQLHRLPDPLIPVPRPGPSLLPL